MSLDFTDDQFMQCLGAVRQQAITWSNVDPDRCRHVAHLGQNELISLPFSSPQISINANTLHSK